MQNENDHRRKISPSALSRTGEWSRQTESDLVTRCVNAARTGSPAENRDEADIFRLVAQLLRTRYPDEACTLDAAGRAYFGASGHIPRSFPQIVEEGLVRDVARLRNLMEHACAGVKSW